MSGLRRAKGGRAKKNSRPRKRDRRARRRKLRDQGHRRGRNGSQGCRRPRVVNDDVLARAGSSRLPGLERPVPIVVRDSDRSAVALSCSRVLGRPTFLQAELVVPHRVGRVGRLRRVSNFPPIKAKGKNTRVNVDLHRKRDFERKERRGGGTYVQKK